MSLIRPAHRRAMICLCVGSYKPSLYLGAHLGSLNGRSWPAADFLRPRTITTRFARVNCCYRPTAVVPPSALNDRSWPIVAGCAQLAYTVWRSANAFKEETWSATDLL